MKKRIVLCADDFGQAPNISEGILALLAAQRLSGVSCMVNSPYWHSHAAALSSYRSMVDIGLHFNLTEGEALSPLFHKRYGKTLFSLPILMLRALTHQLEEAVILAEWQAQLERFYQTLGFLPAFLDGHQHVHQFPIIRNALLKLYRKHFKTSAAYVRVINGTQPSLYHLRDIKKYCIMAMGSQSLQALLHSENILFNTSFSGIYSFHSDLSYAALFPHFLEESQEQGLIMCHPAKENIGLHDPIHQARYQEYCYFLSQQFIDACEQANVLIEKRSLY